MSYNRGSRSPSTPTSAASQWPFERRFSGGGGDPLRDDSGQVIARRSSSFTSELRGDTPSTEKQTAHKQYLEELAKQIEEKKRLERQRAEEEERREQQRVEYWERQSAQSSPRSLRGSGEFRRASTPGGPRPAALDSAEAASGKPWLELGTPPVASTAAVSGGPRSIGQLFSPSGPGPMGAGAMPPVPVLRSPRSDSDVDAMDMETLKREVVRLRAALATHARSYGSCQCPSCFTPLSLMVETESREDTAVSKWTVRALERPR